MMCLILAYKRVKTMENSKPLIAKKIWLWSLMRASNCNRLTRKILVLLIDGCLREVAAYKRWSHVEVRTVQKFRFTYT